MPSETAVYPTTLGMEKENVVESRARRSEAGPWPRAAGWQRAAGRSWPSRQAAPVVSPAFQKQYEEELGAVRQAYPRTQLWHQGDGVWLLSKSAVLDGLRQHAIFLTGISFAWSMVRSWAYWSAPLALPVWIGPRHTNFFDGSICAFEPTDGTWGFGDSLVELLDLYTVWALRHLHLQIFGRWPGYQAVHYPVERLLELREDEYCGCGMTGKMYGECCKAKDAAKSRVADAVQFALSPRRPPGSVTKAVRTGDAPPLLANLLSD